MKTREINLFLFQTVRNVIKSIPMATNMATCSSTPTAAELATHLSDANVAEPQEEPELFCM